MPADVAAMQQAITLAATALETADVPVSALVFDPAGTLIGQGVNRREVDHDPTAHAEIVAIRQACLALGNWRLDGCSIVVTLEPCAMCAGAIVGARLNRLVFGAFDAKAGAVGSLWDLARDRRLNHQPEVVSGVLADACGALLKDFFAAQRIAPEEKID